MKKYFFLIFLFIISILTAVPMTLIFDTTLSSGTEIALPLYGTVNVTVNWGDGTSNSYTSEGNKSHIYDADSTYTVTISGNLTHFGNPSNTYKGADMLIQVSDFGTIGLQNLAGAFRGCTRLTSVPNSIPISVTNLTSMFYNATSFNQNINSWDVSNITNMNSMFYNADAFNQDIGGWDVSNVEDMHNMFYNATSFNKNLNDWEVLSVTDMSGMFNGASDFNGIISDWNVGNVLTMREMFKNAVTFNRFIGNWNVTNVTDMFGMFNGATAFNQNIGDWNVEYVTNMAFMFRNALAFNQDISAWTVTGVTDMNNMFYNASVFNKNIGSWDVSNVIDMNHMFYKTTFNQDIGDWIVVNVINMSGMFYGACDFNQYIGDWDVSSVTNMSDMFRNTDYFNQDISNWNVSSVTNMSHMFDNAKSFDQNLGNWNVSNVTNMRSMFAGIALSTSNYDALLNGWSSKTLQNYVTFGAGNSQYSSHGETARQSIIDNYYWTIYDGGKEGTPLPLIFSSLIATQTNYNFAEIRWITQSENNLIGFNIYRNTNSTLDNAIKLNISPIEPTNTSMTYTYSFIDNGTLFNTEYFYWVEASNNNGASEFYGPVSITINQDEPNDTPSINLSLGIQSIYPNPFNPSTTVRYYTDKDADVSIKIYNLKGELINTIENGLLQKGVHFARWNGKDSEGRKLPSGIYIFKFKSGKTVQTKKANLLK